MTPEEQRLIDLYRCIKEALVYSEIVVMERQHTEGQAEILALTSAITEDFGQWWRAFRTQWDIPDHPFADELLSDVLMMAQFVDGLRATVASQVEKQ